MQPGQIASIIGIVASLILVGSGLAARQLPLKKSVALAGIWLGIILAIWALVVALQKAG